MARRARQGCQAIERVEAVALVQACTGAGLRCAQRAPDGQRPCELQRSSRTPCASTRESRWRSRSARRTSGSPKRGWRFRPQETPQPCSSYSAPIGALLPTLDATFFALSDPTRRGILERLGGGPATLSELAGSAGLTLNGVKKHVGVLELAQLVVTEKVGRKRECRLGPATLGEASQWIEAHRRAWEGRLDRFGAYVERAGGA